jgi:hypothetical protein
MAQTGYTPIKLYASSTASAAPSASNLDNTNGAELAINITDGKLFYKDNASAVQVIAWKNTPVSTLSGTLAVTQGGTGQTSYTDGQLLIGNSTGNTLTKATLTAGSNVTITNGNGSITISAASSGGDVVGPASATDNAIVRFDLTTGKLIQNSGITIDDSNNITGSDALLKRVMLQDTGWDYYDSSTTNALDYVNGSCQRWAPNTGSQTLTISNWPPSGNLGELLIEGVNLGAATITWPTIYWIQPSGVFTTSISTYLTSLSRSLKTSGTDWVLLWTRDAGTTIYGKLL